MPDSDPPRPGPASEVFEEEESSKSRTGRFHVQHRGGTRVEVGEPIKVGGPKPWMCAVKLVGQKRDDGEPEQPEPTQTLLVRTGRGVTPEEAQREAIANLTLVYGSPISPPPLTTIELKESQRPPPLPKPSTRPSFIDMLKGVFKK
ncbi:MAG: hypothetical protein ACLQVI_28050 [Polyangiaceae bacterium]|jgi:hypothetical protein